MASKRGNQQTVQTMAPSQWLGVILFYLLVPMMLLWSGGDPGWWQAWAYASLVVAFGIGGRVGVERHHPGLMAERVNFEKAQEAKTWDKVLAPLMVVTLVFIPIVVAGLDHRFGWTPVFPVWLELTGFILIGAGYAFAVWALLENRFFSTVVRIQTDRGHLVCDSGPYRIVRHPGYAGNLLTLPGMVLVLGAVWVIIPALLAVIVAVVRTALEDRTLHEELPGYGDYAQRVRYRLIPWIY